MTRIAVFAGDAGSDVVAATVHEPVLDTAGGEGWQAQIESEILEEWARPLVEAGVTAQVEVFRVVGVDPKGMMIGMDAHIVGRGNGDLFEVPAAVMAHP